MAYNRLLNRLRTARLARGWSQQELANRSGVLRSADYRSYLEELPGHRSAETGEIILVDGSAS